MRKGLRGAANALAALALAACAAGGVPDAELPEAPIAIQYLEAEAARQRADRLREQGERRTAALRPEPAGPELGYASAAIATPDSVADFLDRLVGGVPTEREFAGRLALLDPRDRSVTVVDAARRGSLPLDWSPDRSRLLFGQPGAKDFQLYEYDVRERLVHPVTRGPHSHTQGCYLGDGRLALVVVDVRHSPYASWIALSGPGGRQPFHRVSEGPSDHSPACAPDGRSVAFVRETSPVNTAVWIADLAGEAPPRRLSPGRHPVFSPDGEWLAFAAPYQRELRIWRMRPDGSGRAPIGHGIRHEARPAFAPRGQLLAYVAGEDPLRRQLYLRRFDGSGDRILFADGDAEFPVW